MSQAARDAVREAQAEGLTLTRSRAASGYRGVYRTGPVDAPFRALLTEMPSRRQVSLGCFASAEEAALCYARTMRDRGGPVVAPVNEGATSTAPRFEIIEHHAGERRSLGIFPNRTVAASFLMLIGESSETIDAVEVAYREATTSSAPTAVATPSTVTMATDAATDATTPIKRARLASLSAPTLNPPEAESARLTASDVIVLHFRGDEAREAVHAYLGGPGIEAPIGSRVDSYCAKTTHVCLMVTMGWYKHHAARDAATVGENAVCITAFTDFRRDRANVHLVHVRSDLRGRGFAAVMVSAVKEKLGPRATLTAESPASQTHHAVAFWLKQGFYADPSVLTCELPSDADRPTPARSTMLTFTFSHDMSKAQHARHVASVFSKHGISA